MIVINVEKIKLIGNKWNDKIYYKYLGYELGLIEILVKELVVKKFIVLVEKVVKGMILYIFFGRDMFRKLFVYVGFEYKY